MPRFFRRTTVFAPLALALLANAVPAQELTAPVRTEAEEKSQIPVDSAEVRAADSTAKANSPDTVEYRALEIGYWMRKSSLRLSSGAQLRYRGSALKADTIDYSSKNLVVEATGDPTLQDKGSPDLVGYKMKYDLRRKVGQVFYGSARQDRQQFNGMDIRRLSDGRIEIARGDFSTCDSLEDQHYYFYARRMTMKPNQSMVARPVVLNIADVPVAVLPFLAAPVGNERRSGLLTPKFGGDQSQGFYIENLGFYWATNDYMDFTFSGELMEGEKGNFDRTKLNGLYRYNKRYVLDGQLDYNWWLQDLDPNHGGGWDLHFRHAQKLTPDGRTTLSGEGSFVSSNDIRQANGTDRETVLDQQANATLAFRRQWRNNATLTATVKQEQQLTPTNNVLPSSRQLPDLAFSAGGQLFPGNDDPYDTTEARWWEKISYSYSFRGNQYMRETERTKDHPDGAGVSDTTWIGARDELTLRYQGSLGRYVNVTPSLNWKDYWSADSWNPDDSTRHSEVDPSNGSFGSYDNQFSASITADTKLYGTWIPEWGRFTGIRHVVSPSVGWTWAPEMDSNRTMAMHPLIHPGSTYQEERQALTFSLGNDFDLKYLLDDASGNGSAKKSGADSTAKAEKKYGHLKVLGISSSGNYNFAKSDSALSDISSRVTLQLSQNYAFSVNFVHTLYDSWGERDPYEIGAPILKSYSYSFNRSFRWGGRFNAGLPRALRDYETTPWSASLSYSYSFNATRVSKEAFKETSSHSANLGANLNPSPNWQMAYATHYNFDQNEFAEHRFTFERKLHCWQMNFTWTPVGPARGWSFAVSVTDLPDIKLQAADNHRKRT